MTDEEQLSMEVELEVRRSIMASLRIPSEGELIELENWLVYRMQSELFRHSWRNPSPLPDDVALSRIRALLDLARTVQNP